MDKEELIARFESEMAKVKRPGIDKLMDYIRKSDFYTCLLYTSPSPRD